MDTLIVLIAVFLKIKVKFIFVFFNATYITCTQTVHLCLLKTIENCLLTYDSLIYTLQYNKLKSQFRSKSKIEKKTTSITYQKYCLNLDCFLLTNLLSRYLYQMQNNHSNIDIFRLNTLRMVVYTGPLPHTNHLILDFLERTGK